MGENPFASLCPPALRPPDPAVGPPPALMGDGKVSIDIVIFALIAAFLVYRLRNVLGRRTGDERPRANPYSAAPKTPARAEDNVISLPERSTPPGGETQGPGAASLDADLARIAIADPTFDRQHFAAGARSAFSMIVTAFAEGNAAALRPLLSDEIYSTFESDIRRRAAAGETLTTEIRSVDAELVEARMEGETAYVTVRFTSVQTHTLRNASGEPVDNAAEEQANEVVDLWTFARDTRSRDPNWLLVETRTP